MKMPDRGVRIRRSHRFSVGLSAALTGYALAVRTSFAPGESALVVTIKPELATSAMTSAQRAFTTTLPIFSLWRLHCTRIVEPESRPFI